MMLFQEKKQMAICVLAVVLVIDFTLFGYRPLHKELHDTRQARAERVLVNARAFAESEQLPEFQEQLQKLQKKVGNYEANIPGERSLGVFLHKIADLMNEHNLREQLIQPGKEVATGELNYMPIRMQCKGRLEQMFEFYKSLQGLDRSVRIEQVRLVNNNEFSGEVSMQTEAVIYYRQESGHSKGQ
ncbi:MAG: type 4a pilus biogenesis protein PilO [Planctomycetes bacterium]|nr:type 4a pilus biogenesis protein PilO [Planctomycetota bacterium]